MIWQIFFIYYLAAILIRCKIPNIRKWDETLVHVLDECDVNFFFPTNAMLINAALLVLGELVKIND